MTMKQNKTLQGELKKLKEQLKESKEKEERSREIGLELKRYSNKLRDELECLREELINRGDEVRRGSLTNEAKMCRWSGEWMMRRSYETY